MSGAPPAAIVGDLTGHQGGTTPFVLVSAASNNATLIKAGAGQIWLAAAGNVNAAPRFLKMFDKATTPTPGFDTPVRQFIIPGNAAGAGTNVPIPLVGMQFSLGIGIAITAGIALDDDTAIGAGDVCLTIEYK